MMSYTRLVDSLQLATGIRDGAPVKGGDSEVGAAILPIIDELRN